MMTPEALIAAVTRIRATGVATAKDVLASLEREGAGVTLSEVKKACSKVAKRTTTANEEPAACVSPDPACSSTYSPRSSPSDVRRKLASMGVSDHAAERQSVDAAMEAKVREQNRTHRKVRREGIPVVHLSGTAFGMVGPGLPLPDGVPASFALKQVASTAFMEGRSFSGERLGNLKSERLYREYFDDLVADRGTWLGFFEHRGNYQHAENTCGILGTLATIYRQRGALDDCELVLDMEAEVLARYERCSVGAEAAQINCCEVLAYKYRMIRYNLCLQRGRFQDCAGLYRELAGHEARRDFSFDESNYLFMIPVVLNKSPTAAVLRRLSDAEVLRIVKAPLERPGGVEFQNSRMQLRACSTCHAQEPALRTFMPCGRCRAAYYCGKECQRKDWKAGHKERCQPCDG